MQSQVAKLDRFYIPTRYPNGLPPGTDPSSAFDTDDARAAITTADKAIAHARDLIETRGRQPPGRGVDRSDPGA